ncbi:hypothetical protein EXIGLDRAFT_759648 [Exidia glandulosa HHB12029]|uniref:Uncharacterized protein n=1 Tax=Exidia glandulosa HHB12029 TaxID=1314781 RepID=A0A165Q192_EXIGL|nr:hypothetical protein EXIGLDRAFT_759648 [Exidia glandulosa HHB12029]
MPFRVPDPEDQELLHVLVDRELFWSDVVRVFPRLVETNLFALAEQWVRLGMGLGSSASFRASARGREVELRGWLHVVQSRLRLDLPVHILAETLLDVLVSGVRTYCSAVVRAFPQDSSLHARFLLEDNSRPGTAILSDWSVDNFEDRRRHLRALDLTALPGPYSLLPSISSRATVVQVARGKCRRCSRLQSQCFALLGKQSCLPCDLGGVACIALFDGSLSLPVEFRFPGGNNVPAEFVAVWSFPSPPPTRPSSSPPSSISSVVVSAAEDE